MSANLKHARVLLDHATLRTNDLEGTRAFLEAVLDLKPGYRPAFSFPGYWLYADGDPVVHLIPSHGGPADRTGETIDHVGFRLTDHDGMRRKLDDLGIPYSRTALRSGLYYAGAFGEVVLAQGLGH